MSMIFSRAIHALCDDRSATDGNHASYGGSIDEKMSDFHVYAIEWSSTTVRWFVDGVQYHVIGERMHSQSLEKIFFVCFRPPSCLSMFCCRHYERYQRDRRVPRLLFLCA